MAKILFVRIACALGISALGMLFVAVVPFLTVDPTASAGLAGRTPEISVNRALKGDRLPLATEINSAISRRERDSRRLQAPGQIPLGCEGAFSPVASPRLAGVYGRCIA
jgi:hypothetical protein